MQNSKNSNVLLKIPFFKRNDDPKKEGDNKGDNGDQNKIPFKPPKIGIIVLLLLMLGIIVLILPGMITVTEVQEVSISEFMTMVENDSVAEVSISGRSISFRDIAGFSYHCNSPSELEFSYVAYLMSKGIKVSSPPQSTILSILLSFLPWIVIIVVYFYFIRRSSRGLMSTGKSNATLISPECSFYKFDDVAGVDEAKLELKEVVEFLKTPERFKVIGAKIPRGVLLIGPPGTGKTLLAKAVAGEAGVPFISIPGSSFVEMFVGVGASRVRDLFAQAKKNTPSIIFIDELDAVGKSRGNSVGGGHDEREQTLNQLLVCMDGFDNDNAANVIVIAATNRPDVLDPALLRPGRFNRHVQVDVPDIKGRLAILMIHVRNLKLDETVNLEIVARTTPGFTGADLENLANEAALFAARRNGTSINMHDFENARDRISMGAERKGRVISEAEKLCTAYHELGHVLPSVFIPESNPINKVTVIPRGISGGATHFILDDRTMYTEKYLRARLTTAFGGYCAEKIMLDTVTTGASEDIKQATNIAERMVTEWGMSPLGTRKFRTSRIDLSGMSDGSHSISDAKAEQIDNAIEEIINTECDRSNEVLSTRKEMIIFLAKELMVKETLYFEELADLMLQVCNSEDRKIILAKKEIAKGFRMIDRD